MTLHLGHKLQEFTWLAVTPGTFRIYFFAVGFEQTRIRCGEGRLVANIHRQAGYIVIALRDFTGGGLLFGELRGIGRVH